MGVEFTHPWVGVAIPCGIIAFEHVNTTYLMYNDNLTSSWQFYLFQGAVAMIWFSYVLAIKIPPGSPPKGFRIKRDLQPQEYWYKWCTKCKADKPERAHHCKTCGQCVLNMDHHCPWTMQCVGHNNMPHFMRFITWVLIGCGIGLKYDASKLIGFYHMRNMPAYLVDKTEIALSFVGFLLFLFLEFTIGILFIRTAALITSNMSTIEDWESDRIRHVFFRDNFWIKVRRNYARLYPGKPFPKLTSWKASYRELKTDTVVPRNFTYEDLTFQYDLGSSLDNAQSVLGPVYQWLWPFGGPSDDGLYFDRDLWRQEDQLRLPFPIDGGNFEPLEGDTTQSSVTDDEREDVIYEGNWSNDLGETLADFGVDETTEHETTKTH